MCQDDDVDDDDNAHMRTFLQPLCFDVNDEQQKNQKKQRESKMEKVRQKNEDKISVGKTFARINPHAPGKTCMCECMIERFHQTTALLG